MVHELPLLRSMKLLVPPKLHSKKHLLKVEEQAI